ncbi:MAG: GNAT family N-acetyltransferase [Butyrivibrio sp.]|nr:GNAT family N-acetyltransferase [Butyrivibrio sp.]
MNTFLNTIRYKENALCYNDYCRLRESVDWLLFSKEQTQKMLENSLYTIIAIDDKQTIGMGRLIGDGMYFLIADIVVQPDYQSQGIGSKIVNMLSEYVDKTTPIGGRSTIQLIAEKGKEAFYEKMGFKIIPHEFCGSGMRKVIRK